MTDIELKFKASLLRDAVCSLMATWSVTRAINSPWWLRIACEGQGYTVAVHTNGPYSTAYSTTTGVPHQYVHPQVLLGIRVPDGLLEPVHPPFVFFVTGKDLANCLHKYCKNRGEIVMRLGPVGPNSAGEAVVEYEGGKYTMPCDHSQVCFPWQGIPDPSAPTRVSYGAVDTKALFAALGVFHFKHRRFSCSEVEDTLVSIRDQGVFVVNFTSNWKTMWVSELPWVKRLAPLGQPKRDLVVDGFAVRVALDCREIKREPLTYISVDGSKATTWVALRLGNLGIGTWVWPKPFPRGWEQLVRVVAHEPEAPVIASGQLPVGKIAEDLCIRKVYKTSNYMYNVVTMKFTPNATRIAVWDRANETVVYSGEYPSKIRLHERLCADGVCKVRLQLKNALAGIAALAKLADTVEISVRDCRKGPYPMVWYGPRCWYLQIPERDVNVDAADA